MGEPKPLAECHEEDFENHHALVYGRVRVWNRAHTDDHETRWHWSKVAWWKGMWFPHRGPPSETNAWGIYAGGNDGHTGPGDAELTHLLPLPPTPDSDAGAGQPGQGERVASVKFTFDPACKICHGQGRYVTGYSGREDDGNAPIWDDCDCFILVGHAGHPQETKGSDHA